ncbi:MAG: LptF/LptG family permease [Bdellovibrionales bacterium]
MLSLIDRYIAKNFIINFLTALAGFVVLFLSVDYLSNMTTVDASGSAIANYYKYLTPSIIHQMLPMACIVATIFTLSALNKNSELISLFAMGSSLARVSAPILVIVSILSAGNFVASSNILPKFNELKDKVYWLEIRKRPGMFSTVKTNKIWYRSGNIFFNIKSLNAPKKLASGASFYYFDSEWELVQTITAKNVLFGPGQWTLKNGLLHIFPEESSFPLSSKFETKIIQMNEELADIQLDTNSSDRLGAGDLKRYIEKNKNAGIDTVHFEVAYHQKFSYAASAFILVLLGIPFSVKRERAGSMVANLGLCLGLVVLFWACYSSFVTMAKYGSVPPILGAWAANVLLGGFAVYLISKLRY